MHPEKNRKYVKAFYCKNKADILLKKAYERYTSGVKIHLRVRESLKQAGWSD
jgi:hypothetical protein